MNPETELQRLLDEHSFSLARQRKRKVYRNPDGLTFVTASTPSDRWAAQNSLGELRRILKAGASVAEHPQPWHRK
jgi:hypothetical protein